MHLILATRDWNGRRFQSSGLPYAAIGLVLVDYVDMRFAYDLTGHPEYPEQCLDAALGYQRTDGLFSAVVAQGQTLFTLTHHYLMTRNAAYAQSVLPAVRQAIAWSRTASNGDPYGLLQPSFRFNGRESLIPKRSCGQITFQATGDWKRGCPEFC